MSNLHGVNPVLVEWVDSMGQSGWKTNTDTTKGDLRCVTVGHLVSKDKDSTVLALNKSAYQIGEIIEIPLLAVKKIRKLKV